MTDTDSTLDALRQHVTSLSEPDTDDLMDVLLVLADCHEECGEQPTADCLRWCRKHGKRPWQAAGHAYKEYHWYDETEVDGGLNTDPASDLPSKIYKSLDWDGETQNEYYRRYKDCPRAWAALFAAWPAAHSAGWNSNAYAPLTQQEIK